jgi:hypothetical protein
MIMKLCNVLFYTAIVLAIPRCRCRIDHLLANTPFVRSSSSVPLNPVHFFHLTDPSMSYPVLNSINQTIQSICILHPKVERCTTLELVVLVFWERLLRGLVEFRFVLVLEVFVKGEFWRLQGGSFYEVEGVVSRQLSSQPQKWLLKVVVGFGGDIVVLQILLPVERDLLRLDLAVLDLDLVPGEDDGNVFANTGQITVPVRYVFVGDPRGHIKHDNGTLALDVVAITQPSEFLGQEESG